MISAHKVHVNPKVSFYTKKYTSSESSIIILIIISLT